MVRPWPDRPYRRLRPWRHIRCEQLALGCCGRSRTRDLLITSPTPYRYTTESYALVGEGRSPSSTHSHWRPRWQVCSWFMTWWQDLTFCTNNFFLGEVRKIHQRIQPGREAMAPSVCYPEHNFTRCLSVSQTRVNVVVQFCLCCDYNDWFSHLSRILGLPEINLLNLGLKSHNHISLASGHLRS